MSDNKEILERVLLLMKYDNKITLTENKVNIFEQQINDSEKRDIQNCAQPRNYNWFAPKNKTTVDTYCSQLQKKYSIYYTEVEQNKPRKTTIPVDKSTKPSASSRKRLEGTPPGFTTQGWKDYNEELKKLEIECSKKGQVLQTKYNQKKQEEDANPKRGMYYSDELFQLGQEIKNLCLAEKESLKSKYYNEDFPFGIEQKDIVIYNAEYAKIISDTPLADLNNEYCKTFINQKNSGEYIAKKDVTNVSVKDVRNKEINTDFSSYDDCVNQIQSEKTTRENLIITLNKKYGKVEKEPEVKSVFDKYRLLFEFGAMAATTVLSYALTIGTEGLTGPLAAATTARLGVLYNLVLDAGLFGSLAYYDYKKGDSKNAAINIIFAFLPLIHKLKPIAGLLGKFSQSELLSLGKSISSKLTGESISSVDGMIKFMKKLTPQERELFVKAVKIDPKIMKSSLETLGKESVNKLGAEGVKKSVLGAAKEIGVKGSGRIMGKFLTNTKFVNWLTHLAATLSVDLTTIHLFGDQIYNLIGGETNDMEIQLKRIEDYYNLRYDDPKERLRAIEQDAIELEKKNKKVETKIKKIALGKLETETKGNPIVNGKEISDKEWDDFIDSL